jgi:hypothetical protein
MPKHLQPVLLPEMEPRRPGAVLSSAPESIPVDICAAEGVRCLLWGEPGCAAAGVFGIFSRRLHLSFGCGDGMSGGTELRWSALLFGVGYSGLPKAVQKCPGAVLSSAPESIPVDICAAEGVRYLLWGEPGCAAAGVFGFFFSERGIWCSRGENWESVASNPAWRFGAGYSGIVIRPGTQARC